jgi:hypothetical protein
MATQGACDLGLIEALLSERSEHISFSEGELLIRHGEGPLLGG